MEEKYKSIIETCNEQISSYNRKANIVGIVKLLLVALLLYSGYKLYNVGMVIGWLLLFCVGLILFVAFSVWHNQIFEQISYEKGIGKIAGDNLKRLSGEWRGFEDVGEEYRDQNHSYAMDLDIVGKNSLFQFLNSTNTYYGRKIFAKDLLDADYSVDEIKERQKAIGELSKDYDWTSNVEYFFSKIGVDDTFLKLLSEMKTAEQFSKVRWLKGLFRIFRFLTVIAFLYVIIRGTEKGTLFLTGMLLLQLICWIIGGHKTKKYLGSLKGMSYKLSPYNDVICEVMEREFTCDALKDMKAKLGQAQRAIAQLTRISENIKHCNNEIANFLLNVLFLWDYKNVFDYEKWRQQYADDVEIWFMELGKLESLISFTNLVRNCSHVCVPNLSSEKKYLKVKHMGHPLISNKERVCNDFTMENEIVMISGSNMSGKSTFMRTVGINLVLANAGSFVCAKEMEYSLVRVMTSMRIVDYTTEGISTFYSELLRIKEIVDAAGKDNNVLFLIDEIFRGTNSVDRLKGAEGVIERLQTLGSCGFLTTHDLELCKMEKAENNIVNYSFYESYKEDEMYFDYKIKKGIAKTTNAEFLLKKVGIL